MSICLESGVYDTFRRPVESSATNGDRKEEEAFREGEKERTSDFQRDRFTREFSIRRAFFVFISSLFARYTKGRKGKRLARET